MEKRTVVRYYATCEKEYKSAAGAKRHEKVCRCFTNPKYRTCNTCKHNGGIVCDNDGFQSWNYIDCKHPENRDIDFDKIKIPNSVYGSCANCPFWENDNYKGEFEEMKFRAKVDIIDDSRQKGLDDIYKYLWNLVSTQDNVPLNVSNFLEAKTLPF